MTLGVDVAATFSADGAESFHVAAAFTVEDGETVVVLGPSGSGKTLLLETVGGFHDHDGTVSVSGVDVSDRRPEQREFGFVFQDYALFPHLTVRENVRFGERYHERTRDPDALLSELGIDRLADRYPPTLSGGEAQRVALARALLVQPEVLLLDEPLSALDVPTRQSLREDMLDVLADATALYVTHNRTTARTLADRIVVMHGGGVVQSGPPEEVFERPSSPFVAEFTGSNVVPLSADGLADAVGGSPREYLAIRPEDVRIDATDPDVTATVDRVVREDATFRVVLSVGTAVFDAFTSTPPTVGESVGVTFPEADRTVLTDGDGECTPAR